ncbi:MAG TPA: tyrosine-type recombinase/integrase [Thermoplasmata archaeon]|nr:tyrosine-type recombinase/integrase [Thermoplasmata archaeon]
MFLASRPRTQARSHNHLLGVICLLFDWLVRQDILSDSPVHFKRRRVTTQRIPFLFDLPQARKLLEAAALLPDNSRALLRGITYKTIFLLLYGLGLRVGEVSRLIWKEVDMDRHLLIIRNTKFAKDRLVPFGPKIEEQLHNYRRLREQRLGITRPDDPVFSFSQNKPIHPCTISQTFHYLFPRLKLVVSPKVTPPRLHDLRHSFAVGTLLRLYRAGIDPAKRLIHLSTFLGHVNPASTP